MKNILLHITLLIMGGVLFSSCNRTSDKLVINTQDITDKQEKIIKFYSYKFKELGAITIKQNGKTEFTPEWESPQVVKLIEKGSRNTISFMYEKGNVVIDIALNKQSVDTKNTKINYIHETQNVKDFKAFQQQKIEFEKKDQKLSKDWNALIAKYKTKDELAKVRKPLDDAYSAFLKEKSEYYNNYVKKNNNVISQLLFLTDLRFALKTNTLRKILDDTPEKFKNTPYYKDLEKKYSILKNLSIGSIAPEIVNPDTLGNNLALSSLRGKYVLLDFWASWCSPCRKENPWVKKAYNRFHQKGFDVYAVSLDYQKYKNNWLKAIKQDKLPWHHVSVLKGWKDPAVETYNIRGIPSPFLLDPEGKIIAKGDSLREEKLIQTLEKIFNK